MTKQSADNACGSSALRELHDASPAGLWAADLDDNGQGDFIIDFGGQAGL